MIIHTVVFKTRHPSGSQEEKSFLQAGIALGDLPMVANFQCYRQISQQNEFEFGFSMEFNSELDYEAYNVHPEHLEFVEARWKNEVDKFMEIDYVKHEFT